MIARYAAVKRGGVERGTFWPDLRQPANVVAALVGSERGSLAAFPGGHGRTD